MTKSLHQYLLDNQLEPRSYFKLLHLATLTYDKIPDSSLCYHLHIGKPQISHYKKVTKALLGSTSITHLELTNGVQHSIKLDRVANPDPDAKFAIPTVEYEVCR